MQQVDNTLGTGILPLYDRVVVRFRDESGQVREVVWQQTPSTSPYRHRVEDLSSLPPMSEAAARRILQSWAEMRLSVQPT